MKKIACFLLIYFLLTLSVRGQLINGLPVDQNGNLNVNKVVLVDGTEKADLYLRANQFYSMALTSSDREGHADSRGSEIVGKGVSDVWITHGSYLSKEQLCYTVKIQCKDGRFKYEIYDFYFKNHHGQLPAKTILDKSSYYENDGSDKAFNKAYKVQFDETVRKLAAELESTMQTQFARN